MRNALKKVKLILTASDKHQTEKGYYVRVFFPPNHSISGVKICGKDFICCQYIKESFSGEYHMYQVILLHSCDYFNRLLIQINVATDEGKGRYEIWYWTNRWNWSSCTKLALSASWTHGLWSWVQIPLRSTFYATLKNPSALNTIYIEIDIYIHIYLYITS